MNLKTEFKKEMHTCAGLTECELRQGREAIRYFQQRTKQNPFFAIATGALHGSRVSFEPQQRYVEKIVKMNPKELIHDDVNTQIIKGAQFYNQRAKALADTTRCYLKHCGPDGKKCLHEQGRKRVMNCIKNSSRYMGKKTYDLVEEYLGNPKAVAVDRHIQDWACNQAGICYIGERGKEKGVPLSEKQYKTIQKSVVDHAKKCKVTPIELQVSVWLAGACKSRKKGHVWLGEGGSIACCKNGISK